MRVMLVTLPALLAAAGPAQSLPQLVAAAEKLGVRTGVYVRDLDRGDTLYAHRAGEPFLPASNLKVLTAAAVLWGLGPNFEFRTRFALRSGRLRVEAGGDPNWITGSEHDPARLFDGVAQALRAAGVAAVAGLDLEPGSFGGPARPAGWPANQLDLWYCAPTGPFVLDQGTFSVRLQAGDGGTAAVAVVAPAVAREVRGSVAVVATAKGAVYGAIDLGEAVKVNGRFPRRSPPVVIRNAVRAPEDWYLAALQARLHLAGVAEAPGALPPDQEVAVVRTPLAAALRRVLQDSSNFDAEQCTRVLGAEREDDGSLAGGLRAVQKQLLAMVGNLPPDVVLADGSGLSRGSRVTPGLLVATLREALRGPGSGLFLASLPVAGESGTLDDRFAGSPLAGRVLAKTGWIQGVSALSGVVRLADGRLRLFSILMNYDPGRSGLNRQLKLLQEQMVAALAELAGNGQGP